jgi:hypothetical protein
MSSPVNITESNAALSCLGVLATLRAGYGFRSAIQGSLEGDVLAVQLRDIQRDRLNWSGAVRTTLARDPGEAEWLRSGDILFAFRGTRFFAVVLEDVPARSVASTQFMLMRVRDRGKVLPAFLAWQLNQSLAQRYFQLAAAGTAQRSLRRDAIEAVTVVVPSLERQRSVMELVSLARREREAMEELIRIREQQLAHVAASLLGADQPGVEP